MFFWPASYNSLLLLIRHFPMCWMAQVLAVNEKQLYLNEYLAQEFHRPRLPCRVHSLTHFVFCTCALCDVCQTSSYFDSCVAGTFIFSVEWFIWIDLLLYFVSFYWLEFTSVHYCTFVPSELSHFVQNVLNIVCVIGYQSCSTLTKQVTFAIAMYHHCYGIIVDAL